MSEPTAAEASALLALSERVAALFRSNGAEKDCDLAYRVVATYDGDPHRIIIDVRLGEILVPVDLGPSALRMGEHEQAAERLVGRVEEILEEGPDLVAFLVDVRSQVGEVLAATGGAVDLVDLSYWPTDGRSRFDRRDLKLVLLVEQFGFDLTRVREAYHGYGIRELTTFIRQNMALQSRMAELRALLDDAGIRTPPDHASQVQLAVGELPPAVIARRIIANAGG